MRTSPTETVPGNTTIERRATVIGAGVQTAVFVALYAAGVDLVVTIASVGVGGFVAGWVGRDSDAGYANGLAAATLGVVTSWLGAALFAWVNAAGLAASVRGDIAFLTGVLGLAIVSVFIPVWIVVGAVTGVVGARVPVDPPRLLAG
jgi:hypothetical protein